MSRCPVSDIAQREVGVKFCMMVHIGPLQVFSPFWGGAPRGSPKSEILGLHVNHLAANIWKTASRGQLDN